MRDAAALHVSVTSTPTEDARRLLGVYIALTYDATAAERVIVAHYGAEWASRSYPALQLPSALGTLSTSTEHAGAATSDVVPPTVDDMVIALLSDVHSLSDVCVTLSSRNTMCVPWRLAFQSGREWQAAISAPADAQTLRVFVAMPSRVHPLWEVEATV